MLGTWTRWMGWAVDVEMAAPPSFAKMPDGHFIPFTIEMREILDGFLWEDEDHEPWAGKNLRLRYVADRAEDGEPPIPEEWELILDAARYDYRTTAQKEHGELCRELILNITEEDPGEWVPKPPFGTFYAQIFGESSEELEPEDNHGAKTIYDSFQRYMNDFYNGRGW